MKYIVTISNVFIADTEEEAVSDMREYLADHSVDFHVEISREDEESAASKALTDSFSTWTELRGDDGHIVGRGLEPTKSAWVAKSIYGGMVAGSTREEVTQKCAAKRP